MTASTLLTIYKYNFMKKIKKHTNSNSDYTVKGAKNIQNSRRHKKHSFE